MALNKVTAGWSIEVQSERYFSVLVCLFLFIKESGVGSSVWVLTGDAKPGLFIFCHFYV